MMTSRQRFLAACRCEPLRRPPVWFMRQAGRWLPEYRALKTGRDFTGIVRAPELATEVTLQPLRRFPFDAAILFSDILVVPEALGHPYHFLENGGGVRLARHVRTAADVAVLPPAAAVPERLDYMARAMRQTRAALGDATALLGFAGAPWTLATYLAGDGGAAGAAVLLALEREQPAAFRALMEKLADATAACLRLQIENGADAVQIFDSWAALADKDAGGGAPCESGCDSGTGVPPVRKLPLLTPRTSSPAAPPPMPPPATRTSAARNTGEPPVPLSATAAPATAYERRSLAWIRRVIAALPPHVPVIVFAKGVSRHAAAIAAAGATVYSADATVALPALRPRLGSHIALQGNLAPELLLPETPLENVCAATGNLLDSMRAVPGHILNLAHGVPPAASLAHAEALFSALPPA